MTLEACEIGRNSIMEWAGSVRLVSGELVSDWEQNIFV